MKNTGKKQAYLSHVRFILIGIGLGAVFWMLESAVHVLVFHDVGFFEQVFHPESHEIWMRLTIAGMFVGFGIYSQWIVTARRRAEREAVAVNMELTQIFDTAADAMRVVDKDFNIIRVNETFAALSGVTKGDAIGRKCYEVFWGPLCHTKDCPMIRILDGVNRVEYDSEKVRKDGVKIPCIVSATPFRGADGDLIGIVEDFKDISEREEAEQALIQSHERLRDLTSHLQVVREEERTLIAREIHDELGQALTALKMDVHWLRQRLPGEKQLMIDKTHVMSRLIDWTVQSVRRICAELRPQLLDDFGLSAAMEWEAEEFSKRTDVQGNVGAGTGASVGKIYGMARAMKGGTGSYAIAEKGLKVGALVAVNCLGHVIDPETGEILAGPLGEDMKTILDTEAIMLNAFSNKKNLFSGNTTIGVVATNARFNKTEATKLASMAQNGYARTIRPAHTMYDGDTIFAMSTGDIQADLSVVGFLAARAMERAVIAAVKNTSSLCDLSCYGDFSHHP